MKRCIDRRMAERPAWRWPMLLFALLLRVAPAAADGRYAGATLDLGVGARPLALGEAAAAMSGGSEYFRYNPAALGLLKRGEISLMYAPTFGGPGSNMANFHYIAVALPAPAGGVVSIHWTRFSVDDIPLYPKLDGHSYADRLNNPELRPDGTADGSFSDVEDAYYISFARAIHLTLPLGWLYTDLPVEIPLGLNVKILRQSLYTNTATGVGLDLGMMLKFSLATFFDVRSMGDLSFGFSALDLTRTTLLWNNEHSERIRSKFLTGLAYRQPLLFPHLETTLFWTYRYKYNGDNLYGAEVAFRGLALRLGHNPSGFSAGAGYRWRRLRVDYALIALDFENAHRLSCAFQF